MTQKNDILGTVAIAGTFDRLHKGHRFFISQAFELGSLVIVGLTSDRFVREKINNQKSLSAQAGKIKVIVKDFKDRKKELEGFLKENDLLKRVEIVKINDIYGPTLGESDIEAIVVTEETKENALKINLERKKLNFGDLKIIEVSLVLALDKKKISSTRIRRGEIDRMGLVFDRIEIFGSRIAGKLRMELKKPLGELLSGSRAEIEKELLDRVKMQKPAVIIAVGDEATVTLNKLKIQADISVIDFFIKRVRVHERLEDLGFSDFFLNASYKNKIIRAANPAGTITRELVLAVKTAIGSYISDGRKRVIEVEGEEDLAGLPAILMAPLGSLIFYGQPDEGLVCVEATENKKDEILNIIERYGG